MPVCEHLNIMEYLGTGVWKGQFDASTSEEANDFDISVPCGDEVIDPSVGGIIAKHVNH